MRQNKEGCSIFSSKNKKNGEETTSFNFKDAAYFFQFYTKVAK